MFFVPKGLGFASAVDEMVMAIRGNSVFKIGVLLVAFPFLCFTISVDRHIFTKRNWFLGNVPRNTTEIRQQKAKFFDLLKAKAVRGGKFGKEPLIPRNAVMVYVDVKEGTAAEPEKNESVARVDVAFRTIGDSAASPTADFEQFSREKKTMILDDGTTAEITVLHLFVKMSSQRSWPIAFKAVVAAFTSCVKEVSIYNHFFPLLEEYFSGTGKFAKTIKTHNSTTQVLPSRDSSCSRKPVVPFPRNGASPIPTPTAHYSAWSRIFDRNITVLSCIDTSVWRPIADHCAVTEVHIVALAESIAQFHAVTVGRVGHFASRYNTEMLRMSPNDRLIYEGVCCWSGERSATGWLQSVLDAFIHRMTDKKAANAFKKRKTMLGTEETTSVYPLDLTPDQFVELDDGEWYLRLWKALAKRLEREATAVSHCDFRPGNMLFCGGGGGLSPTAGLARAGLQKAGSVSSPAAPPTFDPFGAVEGGPNNSVFDDSHAEQYERNTAAVVHLDWEGCSVAPILFDLSYLIGLRPERKQLEDIALKSYLAALREAVIARLDREGVMDPTKRTRVLELTVPSIGKAKTLLNLLYVVQGYVAWVLEQFGGIGAPQGNSEDDQIAWREAGQSMLRAATSDPEGLATEIGNGATANDIRLFRYKCTAGPKRLFCE